MNSRFLIIQQMQRNGGSFVRGLASAAYHADSLNYDRLVIAFPEIWERYNEMVPAPESKEKEAGK